MTSKTMRVRIAVVMGEDGRWIADGRSGHTDKQLRSEISGYAIDWVKAGHVVFIEADVPLPTTLTVPGRLA